MFNSNLRFPFPSFFFLESYFLGRERVFFLFLPLSFFFSVTFLVESVFSFFFTFLFSFINSHLRFSKFVNINNTFFFAETDFIYLSIYHFYLSIHQSQYLWTHCLAECYFCFPIFENAQHQMTFDNSYRVFRKNCVYS